MFCFVFLSNLGQQRHFKQSQELVSLWSIKIHLQNLGIGHTWVRSVQIKVLRNLASAEWWEQLQRAGYGGKNLQVISKGRLPGAVKSLHLHFKESIHDPWNCLPLFFISPNGKSIHHPPCPRSRWTERTGAHLCELNIPP